MIAEQNATNYQTKLQELGLGAAELDAMAKPTSGESLILSGDEDNYLTSLVVKVRPAAQPWPPGEIFLHAVILLHSIRATVRSLRRPLSDTLACY